MLHRYGIGLVPPHRFASALAIAGSVSWLTPASGAVLHSGFPQTVGGLASGVSTVRLYWAGSMTLAATASVVAGAWSTTVTPAAAQVGETSLLAVAGGARAALAIVVRATPLDLNAVGWWISNNGALADSGFPVPFGAVTLDEASVDGDLTTWAQTDVTVSGSQSDPFGGSSAYRINIPNDSTPLPRKITGTPSAKVTTYTDYVLYVKNDSGPDCVRGVNPQAVVNARWCVRMSDGAHQEDAGVTVTVTDIGGGWLRINVANRVVGGVADTWSLSFQDQYSVGLGSYTGDGAGVFVYGVSLTQPRVSVITDESLTALGAKRNAHLTQGTSANQPLFYEGFEAINGLPVASQEAGRAALLTTTHADVLASVAGADAACVVSGVARLGANGRVFNWYSAGYADTLRTLYRDGTNVRSYRDGGASVRTFAGGGTAMSSACTFALIGYGLEESLWVNGVLIDTITHASTGPLTPAIFTTSHPIATSVSAELAELALFSDLSSLGSHAAIYAALQPTLQAMGARWGGLAA